MPVINRPRHRVIAVTGTVFALWAVVLLLVAAGAGLIRQGDSFSIVNWELTGLTRFVLHRTTDGFLNHTASNAEIRQYFSFQSRVRSERSLLQAAPAQGDGSLQSAYVADVRTAARLRPRVQARFENAVAGAITSAGLVERLPLYSGASFVWPPVAAGFRVPPHILITSPRNRIELDDTKLLRSDLSQAEAERIERDAEKKGMSALVDQIGGLGAYPSIVDDEDSPAGLMQTIAHEWMHEYLIFHPLGARYGVNNELTLINETVAELVGRELGSAAFNSLGLPPAPPQASSIAPHRLDFNKTLHDLRLAVDVLLKDGKVDEAERRMGETQQELAADGYTIRRINQAYFAFYGSYGNNAAASSPLGAKINAIRRLSPDLKSFVRRVQDIANPADLDRLLRAQ